MELAYRAVQYVLQSYLDSGSCPCEFDEFVYWVSCNEQCFSRPLRSVLIDAAINSPEFLVKDDDANNTYICSICETKWLYENREISMLNFQKFLDKINPIDASLPFKQQEIGTLFSGYYHEDNVDNWVIFMLSNLERGNVKT